MQDMEKLDKAGNYGNVSQVDIKTITKMENSDGIDRFTE